MIVLYAYLVAMFAACLVVGLLLLLLAPWVEHLRWSRRNRKRIGWYS
jgi:hypothetical protein